MAAKKNDEKIAKEIMKRYGNTIDLKASPYLIIEIIRLYRSRLDDLSAACQPPGGPPPQKFDPLQLVTQLKHRAAEVDQLAAALEKSLRKKTIRASR